MRQRLRKQLLNKKGSSLISVLVAFVILLIGIAGFSHAVTTANNMVRRAELLNTATGEVMVKHFYPEYVSVPANESYLIEVYEGEEPGTGEDGVFQLHGRLREREYTVNSSEADGTPVTMTYSMYFYK